ncbi:MAG: porin family protein [Bacteroidia bacterium]
MKKYLFLLLSIVLFAIPAANAQKGFHIGVNGAAINTYLIDSKLYGDVDYAPNFTVGSVFGASVGNNFTNQFGFEMEVNYARLGQKYEYNDSLNQTPGVTRTTGKITLDYIQIPVMLKITGGDFKTRFSAMMGPQFSFLANAWNRRPDNKGAIQAKDDFNGTDIGLLLQFGSDISLTNDLYLNLGLRMYYGFVQANDNLQVISPSPFQNTTQLEDHLLNAYGGINVGLHYIFRNNENPKNQ